MTIFPGVTVLSRLLGNLTCVEKEQVNARIYTCSWAILYDLAFEQEFWGRVIRRPGMKRSGEQTVDESMGKRIKCENL